MIRINKSKTGFLLLFLILSGCAIKKEKIALFETKDIDRIVKTLASDEMRGRAAFSPDISRAADFIAKEFQEIGLSPFDSSYRQTFKVDGKELFNVLGVLPGRSKAKEIVVFSAHYDHIGIIQPVGKDSIANGADDDASGVSAVISLAKAYAKENNNERTLVFAAFTAEEIGGFGSKYFSQHINPDEVVAMINIEMIGKNSKFGPNSLYVTGYERSDLGEIMQKESKGTAFSFYPDPYPEQNLFFRSDNVSLAALGVPAHTFSTVQIDADSYYHTVKDEYETLNVSNIESSIKAIFNGSKGLVNGTVTPSRMQSLKR